MPTESQQKSQRQLKDFCWSTMSPNQQDSTLDQNHNETLKSPAPDVTEKKQLNGLEKRFDEVWQMTKRPPSKFQRLGNYVFVDFGFFDLVPINTIAFVVGHILVLYSIYVTWTFSLTMDSIKTNMWNAILSIITGLGVGSGAHRLWTHKSYTASFPLQVFLCIAQCISGQNCLFIWCRDHRVHHKFSDTDADPHNINRGAFFAHVGWLIKKKHPDVITKGAKLSMDDLENDPVVSFQRKHYYWIYLIFAVAIPVLVPVLLWNESLYTSFFVCYVFRQGFVLHATWFVNSAAHLLGDKPYDPDIHPVENDYVSIFTLGEGYHNFHHAFPYDYRAADVGPFNMSRCFIESMASLGYADKLKIASKQAIQGKQNKSRNNHNFHELSMDNKF